MAKRSSASKNNKGKQNQLDNLEQQVLNQFKQINKEDISSVKDLTSKVKDLLKDMESERKTLFETAKSEAEEYRSKLKEEAHRSAENIEEAAKKRADNLEETAKKNADKIIEQAEIEKQSILDKCNEELSLKNKLKEEEWAKKDLRIAEVEQKLKEKIDQKEEELYKLKISKFDDFERELQNRHEELTKLYNSKIKDLNKQYSEFVEDTVKELEEKSDLIATLEIQKQIVKKLEAQLKVYRTHMQEFSTSKFTQINNENELLKEQNDKLEEMLKEKNNEIIEYKKKVAELLSDPNFEQEYELLKREIEELRDFKNNSYSLEAVENWKQKAESYDEIVLKNRDYVQENTKLLTIIDQEKIDKVKLSRLNTAHQILTNELEQARQDLEIRRDEYRNIENRFIGLNDIDLKYQSYVTKPASNTLSLKQIVERFHDYMASGWYNSEKLYFDYNTLRAFIAGMASSSLILLEGLSGTGKSSLPQAFGSFIRPDGSNTSMISVQQSWRDRNELLGYFNEFTKTYKETEFLKVLYNSVSDYNNIHVIVLDEINIARVEYYFADFLSALQMNLEERFINLISNYSNKDPKKFQDGNLLVTNNVWFVGTANDDDSTFMISDKVYDRAISIYFDKKGVEIDVQKATNNSSIDLNAADLHDLFENAIINNPIPKDFKDKIGLLDDYIKDTFGVTFGNRIEKQIKQFIPVYIESGGTLEEAFDLIFERKVIRKFESRLNAKMKRELDDLELHIAELFGDEKLPRSIKMIQHLKEVY